MKRPLAIILLLTIAVLCVNGCTMGRGAFEGLNPLYWLKPSTYQKPKQAPPTNGPSAELNMPRYRPAMHPKEVWNQITYAQPEF